MKKIFWIAAHCALLFAAIALFTGCPEPSPGGSDPEYWKVTFDLNGGGTNFTNDVLKGQKATRPADPVHTAAGLAFVDWFNTAAEADSGTAAPFDFNTAITADKTLYAGWQKDSANYWFVTFHDEDTVVKTVSVSKAGDQKIPVAEIPGGTYSGGEFKGWFTSAAADPYSDTAYVMDTVLTADLDLYAKFRVYFDVTFHMNGGGADNIIDRVEKGTKAAKPANPSGMAGLEFIGWSEDSEADADPFTDGFDFDAIINADTTVYAIWKVDHTNFFEVSFHGRDGTRHHIVLVHKTTGDQKVSEPNPSQAGWEAYGEEDFKGWFTSSTADPYSDTTYNFGTVLTDDLDLYAKFKVFFDVIYNMNGGSGTDITMPVEKNQKAMKPPADVVGTRANYIFSDSWFLTAFADPDADTPFDFDTFIIDDTELFAGWKSNNYVVRFIDDDTLFDEVVIDKSSPTMTISDRPFPDPEKPDWYFIGWFEDADGNGTVFNFDGATLTGNLNLHAVYGQASEVILISNGLGGFASEYYLGYDIYEGPLVKINGKTAIQINAAKENPADADMQYRMYFTFDTPVNIKDFGFVEIDYECAQPLNGNISLFTGGEEDENLNQAIIAAGTHTGGKIKAEIGKALWGASRELRAIEYWNSVLADYPPIYITRMELTGTPDPDDVEPEDFEPPVAATGVFMVAGPQATEVPASGAPPTTPVVTSVSIHKSTGSGDIGDLIYVHFDPAGDDFYSMEVNFNWTGGSGNVRVVGGYDSANTRRQISFGGGDYAGYKSGTFSITMLPKSHFPSNLDPKTLNCIAFCIGANDQNTESISVTGITFVKTTPPPADNDYVVFDGTLATGVTVANDGETTPDNWAIVGGELVLSYAPKSEFRVRLVFSPAVDISGYTKLKIEWEGNPSSVTTLPGGGNVMAAGFDSVWDSAFPGPIAEIAVSGATSLTNFQYWTNQAGGLTQIKIKKIWFEP
jgi:hypothetical protein